MGIWGNKNDDTSSARGSPRLSARDSPRLDVHRNASRERQARVGDADERTHLLPPPVLEYEGYLSPDDPAVSIYFSYKSSL